MVAVVLFSFALVTIVLLFVLKTIELYRGRIFAPLTRAKLDRLVVGTMHQVETAKIEDTLAEFLRAVIRRVEHDGAVILLFLVRVVERRLVGVIAAIRGRRRIEKKDSSEYVKTIKEHKHTLKNGE